MTIYYKMYMLDILYANIKKYKQKTKNSADDMEVHINFIQIIVSDFFQLIKKVFLLVY